MGKIMRPSWVGLTRRRTGMRRSRHCRASTPISISAMFSPMLGGVVDFQPLDAPRSGSNASYKGRMRRLLPA